MSDNTLRSRIIRLAHEDSGLRPHLLPILVAAQKAKTPEGAKQLYEDYIRGLKDPDRSKKTPKDFYDSKGGEDLPARGSWEREDRERAESKREKGEKYTKERQKEQPRGRQRDVYMGKGRDKARKELQDIAPAQLRSKAETVLKRLKIDPTDDDALDQAIDKNRGAQRVTKGPGETESQYRKRMEDLGYDQAVLSKYKKVKGDKGEKAKRKTKLTDLTSEHGLEDSDVTALRGYVSKQKAKAKGLAEKKKDDKAFMEWYGSWWSKGEETEEDHKRHQKLREEGRAEKRKQTPAQMKAEFLKNADPEMKARVQKMTPAEFQAMLSAIMDEEEVEVGGKKASLRSSIIRLAHEDRTLRRHLLPLLREAYETVPAINPKGQKVWVKPETLNKPGYRRPGKGEGEKPKGEGKPKGKSIPKIQVTDLLSKHRGAYYKEMSEGAKKDLSDVLGKAQSHDDPVEVLKTLDKAVDQAKERRDAVGGSKFYSDTDRADANGTYSILLKALNDLGGAAVEAGLVRWDDESESFRPKKD